MNRSMQTKYSVHKFLGKYYCASDSKTTINLLDLYESYLEYVRDNCNGYQLSIGDFSKEIKEVYPNTVIGDDKSISGITKKVYHPPAPIVRDVLGDAIITQLRRMMPYTRESFTAAQVARFNDATLDEAKVEAWLQQSSNFYYNLHKNRWLRGSD